MDEENKNLIKALESIFRILDSLKYECSGREYTLDEDQMSWIFFCKDLAELTIDRHKDNKFIEFNNKVID